MKPETKTETGVSNYASLGAFFFDENIRVDKIIWLAACSCQPPDAFEEFLEYNDGDEIKKLFGFSLPEDAEEALSKLARKRKNGFIVEASTPIPVTFHEGGGFTSHGFGWCQIGLFYTETLDAEFASKLLAWKEGVVERTRKKLEDEAIAKAQGGES